VGTPDMVNAQIDRLWKQSDGGFGAYLMLAHNWANFDATRKSYDLVARHVFPRWQGQMSTQHSADLARLSRPVLADIHSKAVEAATQKFAAEVAARVH
jgi:limonene 1,2-monooxygenase